MSDILYNPPSFSFYLQSCAAKLSVGLIKIYIYLKKTLATNRPACTFWMNGKQYHAHHLCAIAHHAFRVPRVRLTRSSVQWA